MTAAWRPVVGYEGRYEVSDDGQVRSLLAGRPRVLRPAPSAGTGYLGVVLAKDGGAKSRSVHALVAEAFHGPRPAGQHVRHLNGSRTDNRATNLTYGTPSENGIDMVSHGTCVSSNKTECPQGHPYSEVNTRVAHRGNGRPFRLCRTCERERSRAKKARLRAERLTSERAIRDTLGGAA